MKAARSVITNIEQDPKFFGKISILFCFHLTLLVFQNNCKSMFFRIKSEPIELMSHLGNKYNVKLNFNIEQNQQILKNCSIELVFV